MCVPPFDFVTQSYQKPHLHAINLALHLHSKPWNLRAFVNLDYHFIKRPHFIMVKVILFVTPIGKIFEKNTKSLLYMPGTK